MDELNAQLEQENLDDGKVRVQRQLQNQNLTFGDYAQRWFVHVQRTGRNRPHSLNRNLQIAERFILPFLAHLEIRDIGKPELSSWMEKLSRMRKSNGTAYSKQTLGSAWALLRCMLNDAEGIVGIENRVAVNFRFAVQAPRSTTPKDTLTRDELTALLEQTEHESPDIRTMIWVSATTGMRFGELSGLEWDDIDMHRHLIHIRRSQVGGKVFPTKTNTVRSVPLYPNVAEMLLQHRSWLEDMRIKMREKVVFPSRKGTYRVPAVLQRPLARCAENAGIEKHVTNQTLRRTVNNLLRQSAGEIAARAVTGHTTQAMTEHYSDVTATEKMAAGRIALGAKVTGQTQKDATFPDVANPSAGVGRWGSAIYPSSEPQNG
ncbi:MAG: site-specific integrase [Deltaproteobacteria bacterium]|nr:site-specific integrase [Deltaproteobacteria bacterium]